MICSYWWHAECHVSYVDVECGRSDIKSISGGSDKPFVILFNYKNCISYRTHCKSVCKKMILHDFHLIVFVKISDTAKC